MGWEEEKPGCDRADFGRANRATATADPFSPHVSFQSLKLIMIRKQSLRWDWIGLDWIGFHLEKG